MAIKLKITQVKSGIGRSATQNKTLEGLGLRGRTRPSSFKTPPRSAA
jgi:ribosomal protein L30/L7E